MRHLKLCPSGGKRKNPYYLNDMMQFVIPFLKPATSDVSGNVPSPASIEKQNTETEDFETGNDGSNIDHVDDEPPVQQEAQRKKNVGSGALSTMKRKQEMSDVEKTFIAYCKSRTNKDKEDDPRKSFLISLLPDLCAMTDQEMGQFKRRVMTLIDNILDKRSTSTLSVQSNLQSCHSITPLCSPLENEPHNINPSTSLDASQWWHM
jgi:hypothetical protein